MKCSMLKYLLPAALLVCLGLLSPALSHADDVSAGEALFDALGPVEAQAPGGLWFRLPVYTVGFAVIQEGVGEYPLKTRQLRSFFPFDMDITLLAVWGYTGDKVTIKITDRGDAGDKMGAIALANFGSEITPHWGNLYSENPGDSFRIIIPVTKPDVYVWYIWLFSWYWVPSTGAEPYSYDIAVSYPQ
jgi:hypothetical protein